MRLKKEHRDFIKTTAKDLFGENTKVYLFGSRAKDDQSGGDIDLYIETDIKENIFEKKLKMLRLLHSKLGEQKIDIVINSFKSGKYIYEVAHLEGLIL